MDAFHGVRTTNGRNGSFGSVGDVITLDVFVFVIKCVSGVYLL
jgi:hypothetical protein